MRKQFEKKYTWDSEMEEISLYPPIPGNLVIELNSTCNHNCVFCDYHSRYAKVKRKPYVMSYENAVILLEKAAKEGFGYTELGFHISGEPLLHKDFARCIERAKALGFPYVYTTSNGANAFPEKIQAIVDAGIDSIRFSINGYDRESYMDAHGRDDFDIAMDNLKCMKEIVARKGEKKISTSISVVLTKKTSKFKKQFIELLSSYTDELVFIPVASLERVSTKVKEEYGLPESNVFEYVPCPMVYNTMYISSEGYVIPCCDGTKFESMRIDYALGEKTLTEIWHSEEFARIREAFLQEKLPYEDCKGCSLINKRQVEMYNAVES